ncbi:hypothetical protein [Metabacillus litoralis]|uniref:hypothetical protein n=1 Tax=Metabacillus litoralis TaxID=152268 RepID=UPI00203FC0DF|nr:hypothetical protein [Metabacillus litoralis]MCM3411481.1 hypothetical protein [Metabacillus litoralis]
MKPVVIRRQRKAEAEQAIKDLEERGYEVIFPLTEFASDGKLFDRDSYNRRIFVENTQHSCWIAKLRRKESGG